MRLVKLTITVVFHRCIVMPVPVTAQSKAQAYGCSPAEIWIRIPPGAWMFFCCECCGLSGRGLCDELITRPEESYRLQCVVVCDLENLNNEEAMTRVGSQRHRKKNYYENFTDKNQVFSLLIYDIFYFSSMDIVTVIINST